MAFLISLMVKGGFECGALLMGFFVCTVLVVGADVRPSAPIVDTVPVCFITTPENGQCG